MIDPNRNLIEDPPVIDLDTDLIKALTQTDANFRALVELLPASLMVHRGGKILYANPSWLRLLGYDRADELIGRSPLETVHPDCRQEVAERIRRVASGLPGTPLMEQMMVRKNGEPVPVEVEGISVVYGGIPAVMVVARDLSKHKKTQEALRLSEENLKAIIEQMPDGVVVDYPDRILFANQHLLRLLGYESPDELIGRPPMDIVHPDCRALVRGRMDKIFTGCGSNPPFDYKGLRKDGSPVDIEVSSIAIQFGGRKAVMAFVRDISDRKRAQEELRESLFLLEKAQQAGHVGTWVGDLRDFTKGSWSKESYAIFGVEEGKFTGNPGGFYSMVHPEDLGMLQKANEAAIRDGSGFDLEFRIIRPDGAVRWVQGTCDVVRGADGVPVKLIGTTQDITDRKEAEKASRERERQILLNDKLATIGTLAAGVAHEINNPLMYVSANLRSAREKLDGLRERLREEGALGPGVSGLLGELRSEMEDADRGMERMREIAKGLKTFAHPAGEEISKINLNELADSAVEMTYPEIKLKASLERDYAPDSPVLSANPGKIQQVLVNLLMNAAQSFGPQGGDDHKIRIRTGSSGGKVFVEVEDTGEGIPPECLARIFDPFFTTKPVGVGTGMGLSICRRIAEGYGGQIRVRSRPGKGSVFTLLLPAGKEIRKAGKPARD